MADHLPVCVFPSASSPFGVRNVVSTQPISGPCGSSPPQRPPHFRRYAPRSQLQNRCETPASGNTEGPEASGLLPAGAPSFTFGCAAAFFETSQKSSGFPSSNARIQVMILVVLAMGGPDARPFHIECVRCPHPLKRRSGHAGKVAARRPVSSSQISALLQFHSPQPVLSLLSAILLPICTLPATRHASGCGRTLPHAANPMLIPAISPMIRFFIPAPFLPNPHSFIFFYHSISLSYSGKFSDILL